MIVDYQRKLYSWLLAITILLAPLNLFFRWFENNAYINGLFSDYLIPRIWLAEIPIFFILTSWLFKNIKNRSNIFLKNKLFFGIVSIIFIRQLFTNNYLISLISFFRIFELGLLFLFIKNNLDKLNKKLIYSALAFSIFGQILLANSQFFLQKNLFEYFILGETQLTRSINIARVDFKIGQFISPYGSTAHPNILAGFLVISSIILLKNLDLNKKKQKYFGWLIISLISWTLFLTQAYSAILSLIIFLTLQSFNQLKKKLSLNKFIFFTILIPVILTFLTKFADDLSINRRVFLNQQGLKIWFDHLIFGTGLTNFLYYLKSNTNETIRFNQPIHHLILLWLTETGLIGATLLISLRKWLKEKNILEILFVLLPIITLDHYLLTQWLGGWLIVIMATL